MIQIQIQLLCCINRTDLHYPLSRIASNLRTYTTDLLDYARHERIDMGRRHAAILVRAICFRSGTPRSLYYSLHCSSIPSLLCRISSCLPRSTQNVRSRLSSDCTGQASPRRRIGRHGRRRRPGDAPSRHGGFVGRGDWADAICAGRRGGV